MSVRFVFSPNLVRTRRAYYEYPRPWGVAPLLTLFVASGEGNTYQIAARLPGLASDTASAGIRIVIKHGVGDGDPSPLILPLHWTPPHTAPRVNNPTGQRASVFHDQFTFYSSEGQGQCVVIVPGFRDVDLARASSAEQLIDATEDMGVTNLTPSIVVVPAAVVVPPSPSLPSLTADRANLSPATVLRILEEAADALAARPLPPIRREEEDPSEEGEAARDAMELTPDDDEEEEGKEQGTVLIDDDTARDLDLILGPLSRFVAQRTRLLIAPHAASLALVYVPRPWPVARTALRGLPLFVQLFDTDLEADARGTIADLVQARVYGLPEAVWSMRSDMVDLPRAEFNYMYCEAIVYLVANERLGDLRSLLADRVFSPTALHGLQRGLALALPPLIAATSGLRPPTNTERTQHEERGLRIAVVEQQLLRSEKRLKIYQKLAIEWMLARRYGFLAMKPGLGKTLTVIAYHLVTGTDSRAVVVADKAVAKQWADDLTTDEYLKRPLPSTLLVDTESIRLHQPSEVNDPTLRFLVTTKTFTDLEEPLAGTRRDATIEFNKAVLAQKWGCIVVDEAHKMLPKSGSRTLFAGNKDATRWLLSGTPIVNVKPGAEATRFYRNGFNREPPTTRADTVHDFFVVDYGTLTTKLPAYSTVDVAITFASHGEEAMYHALATIRTNTVFESPSYWYLVDPRFVTTGFLATLRDRVQNGQLPAPLVAWLGTVKVNTLLSEPGPRLRDLRELVRTRVEDKKYVDPSFTRHVFLLFSTRVSLDTSAKGRSWVDAVRSILKPAEGAFFFNDSKRSRDAFEAAAKGRTLPDHEPVFLFSTYASGGAGLNLQVRGAPHVLSSYGYGQVVDTIVLVDIEWSPSTTAQAIARALRLKQTDGRVAIYTLCFAERTEETAHRGARRKLKDLIATAFSRAPTADDEGDEDEEQTRRTVIPQGLGDILVSNTKAFLDLAGTPPATATNSSQSIISGLTEAITRQTRPLPPPQ
jgi:hypothetical protein